MLQCSVYISFFISTTLLHSVKCISSEPHNVSSRFLLACQHGASHWRRMSFTLFSPDPTPLHEETPTNAWEVILQDKNAIHHWLSTQKVILLIGLVVIKYLSYVKGNPNIISFYTASDLPQHSSPAILICKCVQLVINQQIVFFGEFNFYLWFHIGQGSCKV